METEKNYLIKVSPPDVAPYFIEGEGGICVVLTGKKSELIKKLQSGEVIAEIDESLYFEYEYTRIELIEVEYFEHGR